MGGMNTRRQQPHDRLSEKHSVQSKAAAPPREGVEQSKAKEGGKEEGEGKKGCTGAWTRHVLHLLAAE